METSILLSRYPAILLLKGVSPPRELKKGGNFHYLLSKTQGIYELGKSTYDEGTFSFRKEDSH